MGGPPRKAAPAKQTREKNRALKMKARRADLFETAT
jgi:hypothetical protein